ncbi:hypothetical protein MLD38_007179 [Melastoma candidum]|uniref:Uncharacterized protein n=1 Tax=Melastoma candidum TaxID=119954 RepID=A0ACB9RUI7_9MYRT|nr:hypothetical protein MLD38_007179 [Melastoma candidum]
MKGKGILAAGDVGYAPNLSPVPEDPVIRFRHQALLQDYRDLQKETDAMKRKMEILMERKLTLLAEVQFLRRRYRYFMDNQISQPPHSRHNVKPKNSGTKSEAAKRKEPQGMTVSGSNAKKQKTSTMKRDASPPVNSKQGTKNVVLHNSSMSLDMNQRNPLVGSRDSPLLNTQSAYELPQKQMLYQEGDTTMRQPAPGFDLNEISAEELQTGNNQPRTEVAYIIPSSGGIEEHGNEINSAVYTNRTSMKGPNKAGKRRITWQDHVVVGLFKGSSCSYVLLSLIWFDVSVLFCKEQYPIGCIVSIGPEP